MISGSKSRLAALCKQRIGWLAFDPIQARVFTDVEVGGMDDFALLDKEGC